MKKKFRKLLSEKCKDMGLTDKALDDLVEIGAEGLADDASDEDIAAKVDSLVPYAKAMQGEITRKTQRPKPQSKKPQSNDEGEDEGGNEDEAPEWFKPFQKKLTDLETENAALKAEKDTADVRELPPVPTVPRKPALKTRIVVQQYQIHITQSFRFSILLSFPSRPVPCQRLAVGGQLLQSGKLRAHGDASLGGDAVFLPAALVLAHGLDPATLGERGERAVERAGGKAHAPAAQALDVLHDAIAVQRRVEREQDIKDRFGQRGGAHTLPLPVFIGCRYIGYRYSNMERSGCQAEKCLAEFRVRRRESRMIRFLPRPVRGRKHFARSERRIVR